MSKILEGVDVDAEAWYNDKVLYREDTLYSSREYIVEYCSTTVYGNSIDIRMYKDIYYDEEQQYD